VPVHKLYFPPAGGQEQPVSITTEESTAWTEVDVSAAFTPTYGSKKEIVALVAQGHDHAENSTEAFTEMGVRPGGSSATWEDARGVSGYGNFIYLEGTDYAGGGVAEVVTIPIQASTGKFEYWVKNHAYPPRSIIRIIWCVIEAGIASSVLLLPKFSKVDSDTENFPRLNLLQGTDAESYVLEFDHDASQKAHWDVYEGICGAEHVYAHIVWTTQGGVAGNKVRWDVSVGGTQDNDVWDTALVTQSASDTLLAVSDTHTCYLNLPTLVAGAEFNAETLTHVQIMRDHDHVDDNLAAKVQLIGILLEVGMPTIF
jgi:hypothetical protein